MKRTLLFILCSLLMLNASAQLRSQSEALVEARQFVYGTGLSRVAPRGIVEWQETLFNADAEPCVYVFTHNGGFVLIAASYSAHTVLGYGTSVWNSNDLPEGLQALLEHYGREQHNIYAPVSARMQRVLTPVAPLLTSQWSQRAPYYDLCPLYEGQHCLSGCVATSLGQIMRLHESPSYFDTVPLAWNLMLDSYADAYTPEQGLAVARLMYALGIVSQMNYGTTASSAFSTTALFGLTQQMGYDRHITLLPKDYCTTDSALHFIHSELTAGRPLLIDAKTTEGKGHAYVCDGIDQDGLVHINWGWGGSGDGYFALSAMNGYTCSVSVFGGIQPDRNGEYDYTMSATDWHITSRMRIAKSTNVQIHLDTVTNQSICPLTGNIMWLIYPDSPSAQVAYLATGLGINALQPLYYYPYINLSCNMSTIPAGHYVLRMGYGVNKQYAPLLMRGGVDKYASFEVTADSIFFDMPAPLPTDLSAPLIRTPDAVKTLHHGQLYIHTNQHIYNLNGYCYENN